MKALLLVDLQKDFFYGGSLAVKHAEEIIPIIQNTLTFSFDIIVATKDWHPADHQSFAYEHKLPIGTVIDLNGLPQVLWPKHCIEGSLGAEFIEGFDVDKVDRIFYKGTDRTIDSYSAFYDNGHRKSTGLHEFLKAHHIQEVYIAGLATDYCVKFTALDAINLGYKTFVILEGCRAVNLHIQDGENSLAEIKDKGGYLVHLEELKNNV